MQDFFGVLTSSFGKQMGAVPIEPIAALLGLLFLGLLLRKPKHRKRDKVRCVSDKSSPTYSIADLRRRSILSPHEQRFFSCLVEALPQYHVFPQVSLDALLKPATGLSDSAFCSLRNSFSQKHPDFVICQKGSLDVVAIVELDDNSHNAEKDAARDEMLKQVKYPVLRFTDKDKPWPEAIAKRFS